MIKCDKDEDGTAWGKVLWICIKLDLQQTISLGRTINVKGSWLWVPLTYEKLHRVCFGCGKLIHDPNKYGSSGNLSSSSTRQFGPWLRAKATKKQSRPPLKFIEQSTKSSDKPVPPCQKLFPSEILREATLGETPSRGKNFANSDTKKHGFLKAHEVQDVVKPIKEVSGNSHRPRKSKEVLVGNNSYSPKDPKPSSFWAGNTMMDVGMSEEAQNGNAS